MKRLHKKYKVNLGTFRLTKPSYNYNTQMRLFEGLSNGHITMSEILEELTRNKI